MRLPCFLRWVPILIVTSFPAGAQEGTIEILRPAAHERTTRSITAIEMEMLGEGMRAVESQSRVRGPYSGSVVSGEAASEPVPLSLWTAIQRGIEYNLGAISFRNASRLASGRERAARSVLLPQVEANLTSTTRQLSSYTLGVRIPGFPTVVGPYQYFFAGATLNQAIADLPAWHNYRAARDRLQAAGFSAADSLDTVVVAVAGTYLEVIAADARVSSAQAQIHAAEAVYRQAVERHTAGLIAQIDVSRTNVELQIQRQRLTALANDSAKRRIALARVLGFPAAQGLLLTDNPSYRPLEGYVFENALTDAYRNRSDLKASSARLRAARLARKSAGAQRLPSVYVNASYGAIGFNPAQSNGSFAITGTIRMPIWEGGRIDAGILEADAALAQQDAQHQELSARVDSEVRMAFLDLGSTAEQVIVAQSNVSLARDTLRQARDRFNAGVADSVEVVQAQEMQSVAEFDYIASLFANNLAKIVLARSVGQAREKTREFLQLQ